MHPESNLCSFQYICYFDSDSVTAVLFEIKEAGLNNSEQY